MKRTVIFLLLFLSITLSFSQTLNKEVIDDEGKVKLLGPINKSGLNKKAYSKWFKANYNAYLANDRVVAKLKDSLKHYNIKVFLGTWCVDSKREVPRFYSILEAAGFPDSQLEVIALDKVETAYKKSPSGEEKGLNIHRVPSFIFYKDGKEVNRIVEFPRETLERDMLKIVSSNKYAPNYRAANYLGYLLGNKSIANLVEMKTDLVPQLAEVVIGTKELNTIGYVYLRNGDFDKALYVFDLNAKIFPYKYNVYDSLGEVYWMRKNYSEALINYYKVLVLDPENENAVVMIAKIKKEK